MPITPVPIILGTGTLGDPVSSFVKIGSLTEAQAYLNTFRAHGHTTIDTSRRYPSVAPGTSEKLLGQTDLASWATLDTKVLSNPGDHAPEKIAHSIDNSLTALDVPSVHVMYLHAPDRTIPLSSVCASMASALSAGKMQHWGISNYLVEEVEEIMDICNANNYHKPIVYQGHYNALARQMEDALLPTLRKHGIAFYAYSPAAGGAFSKTSSRRTDTTQLGEHFRRIYDSSNAVKSAIARVQDVADKNGLDGHSVALRWVLHHSALSKEHGDAVIIAASSPEQLEKTLTACEAGPLPKEVAEVVDEVGKL